MSGSGSVRVCLLVGLLCGALLWAVVLVSAPVVTANYASRDSLFTLGAAAYIVGTIVCHQQADRSFRLSETTFPVCARCTGLYVGAGVAALMIFALGAVRTQRRCRWKDARTLLIVSALPTVVSILVETLGVVDPGNLVRAFSGIPLGGAALFVTGDVLRAGALG